MAIYKPSNLGPNLEEIDVTLTIPNDYNNPNVDQSTLDMRWQSNIFEAQVNTTGENVLAYKLGIMENNTEDVIYESPGISLPKKSSNRFGKEGVKNKDFVKTYFKPTDEYESTKNFIVNDKNCPGLKNGKDYQWSIRMYDAPLGSKKQPITKVCDGFLVGSTSYVLWTKNNEALEYDRYVEFKTTKSKMLPIIKQTDDDLELPEDEFRERIKIDWVEKDLGYNKDISKIELVDNLTYDYRDGTEFQVYLCSDEHTLTSVFCDPNPEITQSYYIVLFKTEADAKKAVEDKWSPGGFYYYKTTTTTTVNKGGDVSSSTNEGAETKGWPSDVKATGNTTETTTTTETVNGKKVTVVTTVSKKTKGEYKENDGSAYHITETERKIVGYSTVTGEIRVITPFKTIPENGNYYLLYEFSKIDNTWRLVESKDVSQVVGGKPVEGEFKIIQNKWDSSTKRLFVQPNINIKSDETNPNEIVFDVNGVRVDILRVLKNKKDWTFDKLDNTQWLLENNSEGKRLEALTTDGAPITQATSESTAPGINTQQVPIVPGSVYTVYTDFMDSTPNGVFYARKTPVITMEYHNWNGDDSEVYEVITDEESKPWRDIEFMAQWESENNTQIKYYRYTLFDANGELVAEGEDTYDTDLYWSFRGFQTDSNEPEITPVNYTIQLLIVDELGKEFIETRDFKILYQTDRAEAPLDVEYDCDKQAFKITAETPLYAVQSLRGTNNVTLSDMKDGEDCVNIPYNKILKYDTVMSPGYPNVIFTKPVTFLTQFRLTRDFITTIPEGGEKVIAELQVQKTNDPSDGYDKYSLTLSSWVNYFVDTEQNIIVKNEDRLKIRWRKNDSETPLMCFNSGTTDFYDVVKNDPNQVQTIPDEFAFALQPNTTENAPGDYYYRVVETLPLRGMTFVRYVLVQDYVYGGVTYEKGRVFIYEVEEGAENGVWKQINDKEFIFVDRLEQVPGYDFDRLYAPKNTRYNGSDPDSKTKLMYTDGGNIWLDDFNVSIDTAIGSLASKWFLIYFVIDNVKTNPDLEDSPTVEQTRCYIQMNNERVME